MDKRIDIFGLLKSEGKLTKIFLFPAQETISDPYEKNKTLSYQQSIPIDALIKDVSMEAIAWKYYGNIPMGSKQVICENRFLNLIKASRRIKINDEYYSVYKDGSPDFKYIKRNDYIIFIAQLKPINE